MGSAASEIFFRNAVRFRGHSVHECFLEPTKGVHR